MLHRPLVIVGHGIHVPQSRGAPADRSRNPPSLPHTLVSSRVRSRSSKSSRNNEGSNSSSSSSTAAEFIITSQRNHSVPGRVCCCCTTNPSIQILSEKVHRLAAPQTERSTADSRDAQWTGPGVVAIP
ncbi:hypothetical protein E2C01_016806 [Portunus trituberculatus]|uniref:Uncharacterized protein n=1 Tax=Portunus trituberculatus TaxID=210409 RepID=A0A5B7DRS2_PORTR|nr:hypothetical protein [Portunus trituberculatus]